MIDVPIHKSSIIQDWTAVAQNTLAKSAEHSLVGSVGASMCIQAALDTATAHTGTRFLVQISGAASGDEDWQDWTEFVALIGQAATDLIQGSTLAAGSTDIALTGHALTVLGKELYIEDATLADSEIVLESAQETNEISILRGTTNAHAVGTAIFNVAMNQNVTLPKEASRVQLVVDNTYDADGSTLNYKVRISKVTGL